MKQKRQQYIPLGSDGKPLARFFPSYQAVWALNLSRAAEHVHAYLMAWWNSTQQVYPSISKIAEECFISRDSAKRAIRELKEVKLLSVLYMEREPGLNHANQYFPKVTCPDPGAFSPEKKTPQIQKLLKDGVLPEDIH